MQIGSTVLADPQQYAPRMVILAERYISFDGSMQTDFRTGQPMFAFDVSLQWEGLTEAEKDDVLYAWSQLATTVAGEYFSGPDALTGVAFPKLPDFRLQKDGQVNAAGELEWSITIMLRVSQVQEVDL